MTEKPPVASDDDTLPEAEADARFQRLVGNLVNTPHTPHKPAAEEPEQKPLLPR
jgi:hypothetical protein